MTKNTNINYLYRDGANYKSHGNVVLEGTMTEEQKAKLKSACSDGENFVADQVGFPNTFLWGAGGYKADADDDHGWHELAEIEPTDDTPNDPRSIDEIIAAFEKANHEGWKPPTPE